MKTAISIPDQVFSRADRFARHRNMTRSALFTIAVEEFIQHHQHDDITEKLNEVYTKNDSSLDPVLNEIQSLSLSKEDW